MRRFLYLVASPFILIGEAAAAAGDAVRAFPGQFRATWRRLGAPAPKWPEGAERAAPWVPEVYDGPPEPPCARCGGSCVEPDLKDLDGDPACIGCGGLGVGAGSAPEITVLAPEDRARTILSGVPRDAQGRPGTRDPRVKHLTPNTDAMRRAVEAMEKRKRP